MAIKNSILGYIVRYTGGEIKTANEGKKYFGQAALKLFYSNICLSPNRQSAFTTKKFAVYTAHRNLPTLQKGAANIHNSAPKKGRFMNVFITKKLPDALLQPLRDAGIEYTEWAGSHKIPQEELTRQGRQHQALLGAGGVVINTAFLKECSHLKVVALMSVGYDNVDVATATQLGIPVSNTPGVLSKATAETAFLLMIAAARKAFYLHKKIIAGEWHSIDPFANLGTELEGATLGIFGLGSIGFEMAKKCQAAYDMQIIYHNRSRNQQAETRLGARSVSFEELLQQSDVLSLHAALTSETRNKFDKAAFSQMKKSAIFINTARGAMHNEADLLHALQQGTIWGAGLDVTNPEPMDKNSPLLDMPTVAVLPHIGSATQKTRHAMAQLAVANVIAGLNGQPLPQIVNKAVYGQ